MKTALVVGYGSIGQRHARILSELNCRVSVVSTREISDWKYYSSLEQALQRVSYDYIVIANATVDHYATLCAIKENGYHGIILVEKPLVSQYCEIRSQDFFTTFVGYNLRFHPILQQLSKMLANQKIISAQIYCGQYLPTWRPNRDYRQSYSASKESGGGVLRDLSHELDYVQWLFGTWKQVMAYGGQYSSLDITSDDSCAVLLNTSKVPMISVQINYLDRICQREIIVNTDMDTIRADLIQGVIYINNREYKQVYDVQRDETYINMHKAILWQQGQSACTWREGMQVMQLIAAIEQSIQTKQCINRG